MAKPSYKQAVERKCKECIYDPIGGNGTWRKQVENCTSYSCPLYEVRPLPIAASSLMDKALKTSASNDEVNSGRDKIQLVYM